MIFHLVILLSFSKPQLLTAQSLTAESIRVECSAGYFYDTRYSRCIPCRRCDRFSVVSSPCRGDQDTQCTSCAGEYARQRPACQRCPPCPEGEYLHLKCTRRRPTVCRTCPLGSYNARVSYAPVCSPCSSCHREGRKVAVECTASTDTVCGGCRKGYFSKRGSSLCIRCRSCVEGGGQKRIKKCRRDAAVEGTWRVCGPLTQVVYRRWNDTQWVSEFDDNTLTDLEVFHNYIVTTEHAVKESSSVYVENTYRHNMTGGNRKESQFIMSPPTIIIVVGIVILLVISIIILFIYIIFKYLRNHSNEKNIDIGKEMSSPTFI